MAEFKERNKRSVAWKSKKIPNGKKKLSAQKLELPLMNTVENGMRLVLDCFIASDEICTDNYQFSYAALERMSLAKHAVFPVYNDTDENQKIGSCRPSGMHVVGETNLLLANVRLFVEKPFAAKISENREKLAFVPSFKVIRKKTYEDDEGTYFVVEHAKILSVNLVLAKNSVDTNCKILTVLKDADIDARYDDD